MFCLEKYQTSDSTTRLKVHLLQLLQPLHLRPEKSLTSPSTRPVGPDMPLSKTGNLEWPGARAQLSSEWNQTRMMRMEMMMPMNPLPSPRGNFFQFFFANSATPPLLFFSPIIFYRCKMQNCSATLIWKKNICSQNCKRRH
jgi:hypothetical protein